MKRAIPLVPVILVALLAGHAQADVVTREEKITGFDKVDISYGFTVSISQGDKFSVVTSVDEELVPYLEVVKKGNTLKIGLAEHGSYRIPAGTKQAEITMPELTGLDMSGGSHTTITGFKSTKALGVGLSGGSVLRGDIEAGNARFSLSGGSDVNLTGSAGDVKIHGSGGSRFELADFPVTDTSVDLSGGSNVTVKLSGRLDVKASGGSRVYYLGSPTVGKIIMSGSSSVESK